MKLKERKIGLNREAARWGKGKSWNNSRKRNTRSNSEEYKKKEMNM